MTSKREISKMRLKKMIKIIRRIIIMVIAVNIGHMGEFTCRPFSYKECIAC